MRSPRDAEGSEYRPCTRLTNWSSRSFDERAMRPMMPEMIQSILPTMKTVAMMMPCRYVRADQLGYR